MKKFSVHHFDVTFTFLMVFIDSLCALFSYVRN